MTVREFLSQLQNALDRSVGRSVPSKQIVVQFIAPNSGFCGPRIRPKFLGYTDETKTIAAGVPAEGRYGLTRSQVERILESFDVTLPAEHDFV